VSGYLRDSQLRRQLEEKVKEAARTRQAAEEGLRAARELLEIARKADANVVEMEKPLAEADSAMAGKDYRRALEKANEATERGRRIYRERVRTIIESSENLANLARGFGADLAEADAFLRKAKDALATEDLTDAVDQAKKAWKRGEKVVQEHLSSSFSRAQALLLSAKNLGRDVAPIEDLLSRARASIEANDFQAAVAFTTEGLDTITEDLRSVLAKELRETEDLMRTAQELGADVTKAAGLIERARGDVNGLEFEKARNALRQSRGESEKALQRTLEGKIADFSKFISEAQGLGADTAAAQGHFTQAEAAIRSGNYRDGASLAKQGFQALQEAQFQRVVQTIAASREKFVAAVNLGVDLAEPIANLNKARDALQRNAFREALERAKEADDGVDAIVGRYRNAEGRLRDLHRAFAEAEAFGVSTKSARKIAEQAREAYQNRDPAGLERAIASAFEELGRSEHERTMEIIEQSEFVLTLGERNGADLAGPSGILEEAIAAAKAQEYRKALDLAAKAQAAAEAAIQKRLEEGLAGLRGALPHLGDDASAGKALLNRAEAGLTSRDFDGAFRALDEAQQTLDSRTKRLAAEAVEDLGIAVQMGIDLGADVTGVDGLYKELNGLLGDGRTAEVLATRDRVRSLLATASENLFNLVKNRVAQARELKIDIEEMRDLLKRSKMALGAESYHDGLSLLKECNDLARKATAVHRQTQTALSSAAALVAEARKRDVDVSKSLETLLEAKRAFEHLDYEKAIELASQARAETEKLMVLYTSAQKILAARERLELATRLGIDAPHLRDLLTEAKEAMKAKDYGRALGRAQKCEEEMAKLIVDKLAAIVSASEAIVGSIQGVNLAIANEEIVKARQALEGGQLAQAAETVLGLRERLERLKKQGEEADAAIHRVRELLVDVEALNVEAHETARLLDMAERAYKMGQFDEALDHAAQAEAEVLRERDQGIASMMQRFEETIVRARRQGTDTRSAEKLFERAREFLRGKKYRQALQVAIQSEGEAERVALQQSMAAQAVQSVERKIAGLGFASPSVQQIVEAARRDLAAGDYVKALDAAIRAADTLSEVRDRAEEALKARGRVGWLIRIAADIGADPSKIERIFQEGEAAFQIGDYSAAAGAYGQSLEWGLDLVRSHLNELLTKSQAMVDLSRRLELDPTEALNQFAQARTRIGTEDFSEAYMLIMEGRRVAESLIGSKLNESLKQAAESIAHASKLGSDTREAQERLRQANLRVQQGEYQHAVDLVERALEQIESAKVVEKRFVDLTFKADSTIRNGKKFGIDMRAAEKRLADSMAKRKSDLAEAIRIAEEAYRLAWEAVEAFAPTLHGSLEVGSAVLNEWTEATLTLENIGKGLAKDVRVKILGDAEVEGLHKVLALRAKGSETLRFRIKMTASGSVPLAIQILSHRVFDDKEYTQELIAQVEVAEVAKEKPKKSVADLESRCPICKGMIKKGFTVLRCGCGRDFHELCASRVGRCPVCFRPLGAPKPA